MAYMRDSSGRRLDSFAVAGKPGVRKAFLVLSSPNNGTTATQDIAQRTLARLPFGTTRWRIGFRNANLLANGVAYTTPVAITGIYAGAPVEDGTAFATGGRWRGNATSLSSVSGPLAVPVDGTRVWSDWITAEPSQFAEYTSKVISWGLTAASAGANPAIGYGDQGQMFTYAGNANASVAAPSGVAPTTRCYLDIVIEYEFAGSGQIGLVVGDSNGAGLSPTAPSLFPTAGVGQMHFESWPGAVGEMTRAAVVNLSTPSAQADHFSEPTKPELWSRLTLSGVQFDFAVVALGTNGLSSNPSTMQQGWANIVNNLTSRLRTLGIKRIYWADIPPRTLTAQRSTLAAALSAGATSIQLATQPVFNDSQTTIVIGSDTTAEVASVTSTTPTGTGPYTYMLTAGLANAHASGDTVAVGTEAARLVQSAYLRQLPLSGAFVSFQRVLEESPGSATIHPHYRASDGLHFTRSAHQALARAVVASFAGEKIT